VLQVKKLASAQARQTGEEQSDATHHLYQKLAVLLAKGKDSPSFLAQTLMVQTFI